MKLYKSLKKLYDNLGKKEKTIILFILNYFINAVPISFLVYIVMSLWLDHGFVRYILTYFSVVVFLIYFEYYYIWIRAKWKE